ncbi:MAG: dihydrodipicolinate synthase family protein [Chloroflexi bacterium]|nr:dihydrodipicolinate synthase family protein [Chloroflexota bacterium]MCL5109517.1 dihydrodipicolinate synthase family protein [Chloroflexota bacterium]
MCAIDSGLRRALRGPVVPVITPFATDLAIDWAAFTSHLERLLAAGIEALLLADLVGESWALTMAEKKALFHRAAQTAGGRALLLGKISESALASAAELGQAAREAGLHAVKVILPAGIRPGEQEALDYLLAAAAPSGLPFMVETNGTEVPYPVLDRLAERPDFLGIEETSLNLDHFQTLLERYGEKVPVFCGAEDVLGPELLVGAAGFMTASPNFAPEFMLRLWVAAREGDAVRVRELSGRLRRLRALLKPELAAGRPAFVTYSKAALALLGHPAGPPRPPLRSLDSEEMERLAVVLQEQLGVAVTNAPRS